MDCDETLLFKLVKLSFQQRRKTLRNSLKILNIPEMLREDTIFDQRPEKLSGNDFVQLAKRIGHGVRIIEDIDLETGLLGPTATYIQENKEDSRVFLIFPAHILHVAIHLYIQCLTRNPNFTSKIANF